MDDYMPAIVLIGIGGYGAVLYPREIAPVLTSNGFPNGIRRSMASV